MEDKELMYPKDLEKTLKSLDSCMKLLHDGFKGVKSSVVEDVLIHLDRLRKDAIPNYRQFLFDNLFDGNKEQEWNFCVENWQDGGQFIYDVSIKVTDTSVPKTEPKVPVKKKWFKLF